MTKGAGGFGFARATVLYSVATFVPRVGLFLLLPIYARALTPAEVGSFSLVMSMAGLLAIIYRLGLDATLLRFHFDHERDLGALYASILILALTSIVVLSGGAALVMAPLFGALFGGIAYLPHVAIGFGIAAGMSLQFVPSAWYRAMEEPGRYLAFATAVFGVGAALTLWLVVTLQTGVVGALLGQLGGACLIVAAALFVVLRIPRLRVDRDIAARALRFGLPLVPHATAAWVLNASDRWLLAWSLPLPPAEAQAEIGVYWIGYQLGYAVALLGVSVQAAWLPVVYRQIDPSHGGRVVGAMVLLAAGVLSAVAVGLAAIGPELIAVVAGETYADAAPVLAIVAAASMLYGLYAVAVPVLLHERSTSTMAAVTLGAALLNVALNVALIPVFGIIGSALATLLANAIYAGVTIWLVGRRWPLRVSWRRLVPLTATAIGLLLLAASQGSAVSLAARVVAAIAFLVTCLWLVRPALPVLTADLRATRGDA